MNDFDTERKFDRVISVEMFEHMRNYGELMRRIASWSKPNALLFIHIFSHIRFAYPFTVRDSSDWMAQHFFTGGLMPSDDLLLHFPRPVPCTRALAGQRCPLPKSAEAWLANLDRSRKEILALFAEVYGKDQATSWLVRWRVFFMACAELFGYAHGQEWMVSHYLFKNGAGHGA